MELHAKVDKTVIRTLFVTFALSLGVLRGVYDGTTHLLRDILVGRSLSGRPKVTILVILGASGIDPILRQESTLVTGRARDRALRGIWRSGIVRNVDQARFWTRFYQESGPL